MQVDGPGSNDAAARQRHSRVTEPAQKRTENANGPSHFADEVIIADWLNLFCAHSEFVALELHLCTEGGQDLGHETHVAQIRNTADDAGFRSKKGCGHDRQNGVFGSADRYVTVKRHAAF